MKKQTRIKINLPILHTRDDAEVIMRELANAVNSQRRVLADRDAAVLQINKRVEQPLAQIADTISAHTDALRAWAESNPDAFPKGRKSLNLVSGTIGFRTGTPALKLLSRAFTWDKVLELLRNSWAGYIRSKEEVAKDVILADVAGGTIHPEALRTMGLKVDQSESFYVDPKLADLPTRQTLEAACPK